MEIFTNRHVEEEELIAQLKLGSEEAFAQIYDFYWKRLLYMAISKLRDLDEAEDVVQDIFVSLWNRREDLFIRTSLNSYLAVAVKFRVLKALAKKQHQEKYSNHQLTFTPLSDNSTQEWIEFEELTARMNDAIAKLPEKCRLVYQLKKQAYYSQKEIAQELEISEKTVEAHLAKAMKSLRANLGQFLSVFIF